MEIGNPNTANVWISDNGKKIHCMTISIGAWDMDADMIKPVSHTLGTNISKVIMISAWIDNDALDTVIPLNFIINGTDPIYSEGGFGTPTSTYFTLIRRSGGVFDAATYSNGVMNRGRLYIVYME